MSHPLGPIPWALADGDGFLRKTDKAKMMRANGQSVPVAESTGRWSACIIDGMSIVQKMNGNNRTFGELVKATLRRVLHEGETSKRIDLVSDVYLDNSIKDAERVKSCLGTGFRFNNISSGHKSKQWRSFLSATHYKRALIEFMVEELQLEASRGLIGDKALPVLVTCGESCFQNIQEELSQAAKLEYSQEEADM